MKLLSRLPKGTDRNCQAKVAEPSDSNGGDIQKIGGRIALPDLLVMCTNVLLYTNVSVSFKFQGQHSEQILHSNNSIKQVNQVISFL